MKQQNIGIACIMGLFLLLQIIFISDNVWWDGAVYAGMGKYIFSHGESGLWEPARPLVWPVVLGLFWFIGVDVVIAGKILGIVLAVGSIFLTYLIGKKISPAVGIMSAFFLAFTPVFFNMTSLLYTGIPSTFLGLLMFYFILKKQYYTAGIVGGIMIMTRFFMVLLFVLLLFISKKRMKIIGGSLWLIIPYFLITGFLYGNPFLPLTLQMWLTQNTGWPWFEPWWYYGVELVRQNIFVLFLVSLWFLKGKYVKMIALLGIAPIVIFSVSPHKEIRFLLPYLPFLFILSAYGMSKYVKKWRLLSGVALIIWLILSIQSFDKSSLSDEVKWFQDQINEGEIWVTNPLYALESDKKVELLYYPSFTSERARELHSVNADQILFNSCDIPCPPWDDECEAEKITLIESYERQYTSITQNQQCTLRIFNS